MFDFIVLGVLTCIVILMVGGLVFTITILIYRINLLESENEMLVKDRIHAHQQIETLRNKLKRERCQRCVTLGDK
ncbi:hypothetical protein D3C71_1672140 [compost metagenome]